MRPHCAAASYGNATTTPGAPENNEEIVPKLINWATGGR